MNPIDSFYLVQKRKQEEYKWLDRCMPQLQV